MIFYIFSFYFLDNQAYPNTNHFDTTCTVANAGIVSLKSLQTCLKKCLYHIPVTFEQNRIVQTIWNFELFDKKTFFFITIFDKELTPFWKKFL